MVRMITAPLGTRECQALELRKLRPQERDPDRPLGDSLGGSEAR